MKRILCYGDSNTWGFNPVTFSKGLNYFVRYDENTRWTSLLQKKLGSDYTIIEEGLCGRTTVLDDPLKIQDLNGRKYLLPCLGSHAPLDLVVLMLGTNDLKSYYSMTARSISSATDLLIKIIKSTDYGVEGNPPEVLVVSPIALNENLERSCISDLFDVPRTVEISRNLPELIEETALSNGCRYLNLDNEIELSPVDYVHYSEKGHREFAAQMSLFIKKEFL